jgi:hypothetical protein
MDCHFESRGRTSFVGGVESNNAGVGGIVGMDFQHTLSGTYGASEQSSADPMAAPDPTCAHGKRTAEYCCTESCLHCGGKTCNTPPNNGSDCCVTVIGKSGRSCEKFGAPCMIDKDNPAQTLTAKRSWFLVDERMLSLTAGVTLPSADSGIVVALEQSLLTTDSAIVVADANGSNGHPVVANQSTLNSTAMVDYRGVTYAALGNGGGEGAAPMLHLSAGPQTGSWNAISGERSNETVAANVFKLWLDLGPAPMANASAGYAILPGAPPAKAAAVLRRLVIVANQVERQVVTYRAEGEQPAMTIMAVIYSAGAVLLKTEVLGYSLTTNSSVMVAISQNARGNSCVEFAFSHPTVVAGTVRLTAAVGMLGGLKAGLQTAVDSRAATCSVSEGLQHIDLHLPQAPGRTAYGSCCVVVAP